MIKCFKISRQSSTNIKVNSDLILPLLLVLGLVFVSFSNSDREVNDYVLSEERAIMLKDFRIDGQDVVCDYWTAKGIQSYTYPSGFEIKDQSANDTAIRDIRDQYKTEGHPMRKAILVNDSILMYMSDERRSPGFYTLRKMVLDEKN